MADSAASKTLEPGAILGKYKLVSKLGEGGMGTVFTAVHEKLGREVAIKTLKKEFAGTEEVVIRFQHEAEAITRIGHGNIVAVYDFGRLDDGGLYYVMERVKGGTLTERMRRMPLTESEIRDVFTQLLSALAAAHNLGVVHRDLKPDNIILMHRAEGERPQIKLLDFGVAKIRDDQRAGPLTTAGVLMGTPRYMAPEQIKGAEKVDGRADIYAVAVMLYEALTGRPPFEGKMMQLLASHVGQPPEPPSVKAQQVGGVMRETIRWELIDPVVLRALAKAPDERYQDCRSFAADLDTALSPSIPRTSAVAALPAVAAPTAAAAPAPAQGPQPRSRGFLIAAVASAAVLLGGGGLVIRALRAPAPEEAPPDPGAEPSRPRGDRAPRGLPAALAARATQVIDQAQGGNAESRRGVMEAIEEVRARRLLPRVVTALSDDNPAVRRAAAQAAEAVGRAGDEALGGALREAAGHSVGAVAVEIAAARLALGDAQPAEELQAMARRASDPALRLRATLALSRAGRAPAALLRAALVASDKQGAVRPALRRAALARLLLLEDPAVVKEIDAAAGGGDADLLLEAAEVLALAGEGRGRDLLLGHAGSARDDAASERTRADPAVALARVDDPRAVPLLLPLLKEGDPRTRARAASALGYLASRGKWRADAAVLGPPLSDPQERVALAAAVALLGQGEPDD